MKKGNKFKKDLLEMSDVDEKTGVVTPLIFEQFNSTRILLLDSGPREIYIWFGKSVKRAVRVGATKFAQEHIEEIYSPSIDEDNVSNLPPKLQVLDEECEPVRFLIHFQNTIESVINQHPPHLSTADYLEDEDDNPTCDDIMNQRGRTSLSLRDAYWLLDVPDLSKTTDRLDPTKSDKYSLEQTNWTGERLATGSERMLQDGLGHELKANLPIVTEYATEDDDLTIWRIPSSSRRGGSLITSYRKMQRYQIPPSHQGVFASTHQYLIVQVSKVWGEEEGGYSERDGAEDDEEVEFTEITIYGWIGRDSKINAEDTAPIDAVSPIAHGSFKNDSNSNSPQQQRKDWEKATVSSQMVVMINEIKRKLFQEHMRNGANVRLRDVVIEEEGGESLAFLSTLGSFEIPFVLVDGTNSPYLKSEKGPPPAAYVPGAEPPLFNQNLFKFPVSVERDSADPIFDLTVCRLMEIVQREDISDEITGIHPSVIVERSPDFVERFGLHPSHHYVAVMYSLEGEGEEANHDYWGL